MSKHICLLAFLAIMSLDTHNKPMPPRALSHVEAEHGAHSSLLRGDGAMRD